jgi:hypothetical protein
VPFIAINALVIAMVILYPKLVTHYKGSDAAIDGDNIQIQMPPLGNSGLQLPPLGIPPGAGNSINEGMQLPALGLPPPSFGGSGGTANPPAPAPAVDLSQPPKVQ